MLDQSHSYGVVVLACFLKRAGFNFYARVIEIDYILTDFRFIRTVVAVES